MRILCAGIGKTSTLEARVSLFYWTSCSGHIWDVLLSFVGCGFWKTAGGICQASFLRVSLGSSYAGPVFLFFLLMDFIRKAIERACLLMLRVFLVCFHHCLHQVARTSLDSSSEPKFWELRAC